ncbi:hypothetical protein Tco_0658886 [Tanacetum coccineum]
MAISVISISSDSSEDSVGTPIGRVILFGTIPTTIPDTTPVITPPATQTDTPVIPTETPIIAPTIPPSPDYTPASPDYSPASDSESDPSEDPSSDHIPPLPATSPFLSSDDDPTDSDTPDTPPSPTHDTSFTENSSLRHHQYFHIGCSSEFFIRDNSFSDHFSRRITSRILNPGGIKAEIDECLLTKALKGYEGLMLGFILLMPEESQSLHRMDGLVVTYETLGDLVRGFHEHTRLSQPSTTGPNEGVQREQDTGLVEFSQQLLLCTRGLAEWKVQQEASRSQSVEIREFDRLHRQCTPYARELRHMGRFDFMHRVRLGRLRLVLGSTWAIAS